MSNDTKTKTSIFIKSSKGKVFCCYSDNETQFTPEFDDIENLKDWMVTNGFGEQHELDLLVIPDSDEPEDEIEIKITM